MSPEKRIPICGEDFCDRCGDCLACYGDEHSCIDGQPHLWIQEEEEQNCEENKGTLLLGM